MKFLMDVIGTSINIYILWRRVADNKATRVTEEEVAAHNPVGHAEN